jgi:hypothetical protein
MLGKNDHPVALAREAGYTVDVSKLMDCKKPTLELAPVAVFELVRSHTPSPVVAPDELFERPIKNPPNEQFAAVSPILKHTPKNP